MNKRANDIIEELKTFINIAKEWSEDDKDAFSNELRKVACTVSDSHLYSPQNMIASTDSLCVKLPCVLCGAVKTIHIESLPGDFRKERSNMLNTFREKEHE